MASSSHTADLDEAIDTTKQQFGAGSVTCHLVIQCVSAFKTLLKKTR